MISGRVYMVTIAGVASPAAAFDLFEFTAAAARTFSLLRLRVAQTSEATTEEEQLTLAIMRGHTTSGSGGSAATPVAAASPDAAAGFAAETMNTTLATGGTPVTLMEDAWNTRSGLDIAFSPDEAPVCVGGERMVVRVPVAPADAVTFRATAWLMEI
jgi:hypothetical protein